MAAPRKVTTRATARRLILASVNGRRRRLGLDPYTARHIQQAVKVARHRGLVTNDTLATAGYRPARAAR